MIKQLLIIGFCIGFCISCKKDSTESKTVNEPTLEENELIGFYIGTYTKTGSEGIYYAELDENTGALTESVLAVKTENPSFLVLNDQSNKLYAVNEEIADDENSTITAFRVERPGQLSKMNSVSAKGEAACYISIDKNDKFVLAANYGGGSVISVGLNEEGDLNSESQLMTHEGSGPNKSRQEAPHAHSIVLSPNGKFAFAADLGIDKIMIYNVDSNGKLSQNDISSINMAPGAGPRHITFHPNGRYAYVINELNSTITGYIFDSKSGNLEEFQTVSTVPDGFEGKNSCADIRIHPNGKFLYGSNRGQNSIASFEISSEGALTPTGHLSESVNWPRNFRIASKGNILVIANQHGNTVITAKINAENGTLSSTGESITIAAPVCIEFMR